MIKEEIDQINEVSQITKLAFRNDNNLLFHGTLLLNAYYIFQTNSIVGETPTSTRNGAVYYGVSTTRNVEYALGFPTSYPSGEMVFTLSEYFKNKKVKPVLAFVFQKDVLRSNSKIIPFDYYHEDGEMQVHHNTRAESEEIVVGGIKNVTKKTCCVLVDESVYEIIKLGEFKNLLVQQYYEYHKELGEQGDIFVDILEEINGLGYEYIEDLNGYIKNKDESTLISEEEAFELGIKQLANKLFPLMDKFEEFVLTKIKY